MQFSPYFIRTCIIFIRLWTFSSSHGLQFFLISYQKCNDAMVVYTSFKHIHCLTMHPLKKSTPDKLISPLNFHRRNGNMRSEQRRWDRRRWPPATLHEPRATLRPSGPDASRVRGGQRRGIVSSGSVRGVERAHLAHPDSKSLSSIQPLSICYSSL